MNADSTSARIKSFIASSFPAARTRTISNDDNLLEKGILDSLGVLNLIMFIEREFKIDIEDEELIPENFQTIGRLTTFLVRKNNHSR